MIKTDFIEPSMFTLLLFELLLIALYFSFIVATVIAYKRARGTKRALKVGIIAFFISATWLVFLSWLVQTGFLQEAPYPRLMFFAAGSILAMVLLGLSSFGRVLSLHLSFFALVLAQSFRLPLELILHAFSQAGTIPDTMTYQGQNFDIVTGILALALSPLILLQPFAKVRGLIWLFNLLGTALLINVARVAIMSSPLPFAWSVNPPLMLAFHLPYALIVPICVGGAAFLHICLFRKLLQKPTP